MVKGPETVTRYGIGSPQQLMKALDSQNYLADEGIATTLFLALALQRPLLLEGDAGVGKTEVAKALSSWLGASLIRLQCYEGIDSSQAVYEWDYSRQLLHLRALETVSSSSQAGQDLRAVEDELFSERFLVRRPLLQALDPQSMTVNSEGVEIPPVLLIDEVDRADDEFEAYLLEILSEYSITIPELGAVQAKTPPITIITSNRTRDLHDALKRRCLYHWVEHPSFEREVEILRRRVPEADERLILQVAMVSARLRGSMLYKPPGIAETLDWARSLVVLGESEVTTENFSRSAGALLKYREDEDKVRSLDISELIKSAVRREY